MRRSAKKRTGPKIFVAALAAAAALALGALIFVVTRHAASAREWFWSTDLPELILRAELPARVTRLGAEIPADGPAEGEIAPSEAEDGIPEAPEEPEPGPEGGEEPVSPIVTVPVEGDGERSAEGIELRNQTDYELDLNALLNAELGFSAASGAKVLIIHSHATEAYMPTEEEPYTPSDPYRTTDLNENVVRVGDELRRVLEERGITVVHNTGLYDYPNYSSSYPDALKAIDEELRRDQEIKLVIDLHRDALEGADGTVYRTAAEIDGVQCAQVGMVVGSNASGLYHPGWEKNLSFALKLQYSMMKNYPSLARPMKLSRYRYNQHMTEGSLIIEVGCTGNTMEEALIAVGYFGRCLAEVLGA